jgi:hypothetical protein
MGEVRDLVTRIAADMANSCQAARDSGIPVRSLFLIGSCSQKDFDDYWFQDFDIHFQIDGLALGRDTINWLRELLGVYRSWSTDTTLIDSSIRDRHWKMIPTLGVGNIGLHATILNSADHFRRVHHNPLLAENMYRRCKVMWGEHPLQTRGHRRPSPREYMHSVGGIGWMCENFARAVGLWCTDPSDRTFYPYIGGYCWNVVSTLLFHLTTLESGKLSGRGDAMQAYLPYMPREVAEATVLVRENRHMPDLAIDDAESLWEAAATVSAWIVDHIASHRPNLFSPALPPSGVVNVHEHFGEVLGRAGWSVRAIPVVDVVREAGESYVGSIRAALATARAEIGSKLSTKEQFELLRDVHAGRAEAKVRIWDHASWVRRQGSHDFDIDRGWRTDAAVWFGWEDGAQALLQRLHELWGNLGYEDEELRAMAALCAAIVAERTDVATPAITGFDDVTRWLGERLADVTPLVDKP